MSNIQLRAKSFVQGRHCEHLCMQK